MTFLKQAPIKGQFTTISVSGGKEIPAINQEKLSDCGPSCVGLVLRMVKHPEANDLQPNNLRSVSQGASGTGYLPAIGNVGLSNDALQMQHGLVNALKTEGFGFRSDGAFDDNIAAMLKERFGYKGASSNSGNIKSILHKASLKNPYIVHVQWEGGGGHWVVCCGFDKSLFGKSSFLFSDPYYGVGYIHLPTEETGGSKMPSYIPAVDVRGHLSGCYISLG